MGACIKYCILTQLSASRSGLVREGVERLMTSLKAQMSKLGCALPASAPVLYGELDSKDELQGFMEETVEEAKMACRGVAPELLLVVLPDTGGDEVRNEVKRIGHNMLGIATQCLDPVKAGVTREARCEARGRAGGAGGMGRHGVPGPC